MGLTMRAGRTLRIFMPMSWKTPTLTPLASDDTHNRTGTTAKNKISARTTITAMINGSILCFLSRAFARRVVPN